MRSLSEISFNSRVRAYFLKIGPQNLHDKPSSVKWMIKTVYATRTMKFLSDWVRLEVITQGNFCSEPAIFPIIKESLGLALKICVVLHSEATVLTKAASFHNKSHSCSS